MRKHRECSGLPVGTTIEERRGQRTWTKICDDLWDDGDRVQANNREMDHKLDDGAKVVVIELAVATTEVPADELEENDYILLSWGFWPGGDQPLLEPGKSQMLWRVAGWEHIGGGSWVLLVDAPEPLLDLVVRAQHDFGWDREPIGIDVHLDDLVTFVAEGQKHQTWE